MTEIFNKKELRERRQMLRRNMTQAETTLWANLRRKQVDGHRFRSQYSVGAYILDFYCPKVRLDIEVDGGSHERALSREYDLDRDQQLKQLSITVLRFTNSEVMTKLAGVVERIRELAATLMESKATTFPLLKGKMQKGLKNRA